jgi:Concanavalin A-like lectin/glucanases superfamily
MVTRGLFVGFLGACLATAAWSACGSDSGGSGSPAAGSGSGQGGSAGSATGSSSSGGGVAGSGGDVGSGGSSGGAAGTAGATATGGSGGDGGATGGQAGVGGIGGAGTGGSGGGGAAGAPGGSGGGGGAGGSGKNCAGNAITLGANGTGTASDTARARVQADLGTDLPIGNANRTVEFWAYIKTTDWVGEKNEVYVYGSPGSNATAFGLDFGTNPVMGMPNNHATLNPYTNGGFNVDSTADLGITSAMDQWVHVAMTWDGSAVRTYVNGTPRITSMGSNGITMLATATSPLTIGCNPPIFNCYNGSFDEFRVWKVARTPTQIMDNYKKVLVGDEPDLVAYFKFDEAPGATTAEDSVTAAGHTRHPGTLMATNPNQLPTFGAPTAPVPVTCP